jgi:hypothetical protein
MAESILFRGCFIRYCDIRQGKEGGDLTCKIHLSADFSTPVREHMEWEEVGDSISSAKLNGALLANHMILTPGNRQIQNHELQIDITEVSNFEVSTVKDDEGEPCGRKLNFQVKTSKDGAGAIVEQYMSRVGRHEGALKVSYVKQEVLPLGSLKTPTETQASFPGAKQEVGETEEYSDETEAVVTETAEISESTIAALGESAELMPCAERPYLECEPTYDLTVDEGKARASLATLHIGPEQWIGKASASVGAKGGFSGAFSDEHVFSDYRIALAFEAHNAAGASRPNINATGKAGAKGWQTITDWFSKQFGAMCKEYGVSPQKMEVLIGIDTRQADIDQALESDVDTGCTSCNSGLPFASEGKHENGLSCTAD